MTCTAEDIHGAWSVPTVPVNPSQSDRQSRPWRGCQRRYSSRTCYVRRTAAGEALSVEYRVMNDADIMLYDVGAYVAMLAHGGHPALLAMADDYVSR